MNYRTLDVAVDGGRLRVAEWGPADGPAIVAIHGITASHLAWAAVAAAMPEARIIAPDLRGRGASSELPGPWGMATHVADIVAVLDELGIDRVAVMGHSMGGVVANVLAHGYPDRVSGVLLVDGGLTLSLPRGMSLANAAQALSPADDRLSMTFPDRQAYRAFARTHPAIHESWSPAVEAYVDYDLVGEPPAHALAIVDRSHERGRGRLLRQPGGRGGRRRDPTGHHHPGRGTRATQRAAGPVLVAGGDRAMDSCTAELTIVMVDDVNH